MEVSEMWDVGQGSDGEDMPEVQRANGCVKCGRPEMDPTLNIPITLTLTDEGWVCGNCWEPKRSVPKQKPGRSKQDYRTPPEFLEAVKDRLMIDEFAWDLAADVSNSVSPYGYYDLAADSLRPDLTWNKGGWAWLNPPYANISPWVEKAAREAQKGAQLVVLVPASVGSNWWRDWVEPYAYQVFLNGRLTFPPETKPYPKDLALLVYHPWQFMGHEIWSWRRQGGG